MKEIFPNYYYEFRCIADKCKHSCCVGWEIDIDDDTMDLYNSLEGELAEKIRANIEGDVPHFVLKDTERCPFLKENGLCEIICEYGDGALCDICALHPRFSNFYDDFTETGLGLCCEEAARLILTYQEEFSIDVPEFAQNNSFFKERKEVFDVLQNRQVPAPERFRALSEKYGYIFQFSGKELYDFFMSLERLDKGWERELERLKRVGNTQIFEREDLQIFFEQLSCYFVFRHFDKGVGFTLLSCYVIGIICAECNSIEEMLDVARMYSSEIEYSEENTQKVADFCFEKNRNTER